VNKRPRSLHAFALVTGATHNPEYAALVTSCRWAAGSTLRIASRGGTVADRAEVRAAAAEWSRYANIDFEEVESGDAEIRCQFYDVSGDDGSWSHIGTDANSLEQEEATMNIGWPDDYRRSLHELGHALGLIHEHQNPLARIP
jgi:hypothetical protein